jgi:hypothetical protein
MPTVNKKYYHNIDLDNNQLLNAVIENLATAPTSPVDGQIYYNTTDKVIYFYNATSAIWKPILSDNIYSANGTLTGNRTVNTGIYQISFTGSSSTLNTISTGTNASTDYAGMNMWDSAGALVGSFQIGGVSAGTPELRGNFFFGARKTGGKVYIVNQDGTPLHAFFNSTGNVTFGGITDAGFRVDVIGKDARINGVTIGKGNNSIATNTVLGVSAGFSIAAAIRSVLIGYEAGYSITTGTSYTGSVLIGYQAGYNMTTGFWNVIIGDQAGYSMTSGTRNTLVGEASGYRITTASGNTLIGDGTGTFITTGAYNTVIGVNSAQNLTTGQYNIVLGSIPSVVTTGSYNVFIGNTISNISSALSNNIIIADGQGNIRFRDDATSTILARLAGTGTRMVVAGTNGELSTQAITQGSSNTYSAGLQLIGTNVKQKLFTTIYQKSLFTDLSDFTATGFTPTIVNNSIQLTSGALDFNQYFTLNNNTNADENIDFEIIVKVLATGYGFSIGKRTANTWYTASSNLQVSMTENQIKLGGQFKTLSTVTVNDILKVRYFQRGGRLVGSVENLTTGTYNFLTIQPEFNPVKTVLRPNTNNYTIWNHQGTFNIMSMNIRSAIPYAPDVVCIGDSKTFGYSSTSQNLRWTSLLNSLGNVITYAGDGDRTVEAVLSVNYIIKFKPKYVILAIGRNDLGSGVSTSTWQSNYQSIVNTLTAAGTTVIHLFGMGEPGLDQTALWSWINSTYSTNKIDISSVWVNATMVSTDNIHPNEFGHRFISSQVIASGLIPLSSNYISDYIDHVPKEPIDASSIVVDTSNLVTLTTAQSIFGAKTFTNKVTINNSTNGSSQFATALSVNNIMTLSSFTNIWGMDVNVGNSAASVAMTSVGYLQFKDEITLGAGGSIQNAYGLKMPSINKAVNNVYISLAGGTPTGNWGIYNASTNDNYFAGKISINAVTPAATAILQADSTNKGFLPPRMTATDRGNIVSAATGLIVYQTDGLEGLYEKISTGWRILNGSGSSGSMAIGGAITSATIGSVLFASTSGVLAQDNANFFWDNTNKRLGIGTNTPQYPLHVIGDGQFIKNVNYVNLIVGSTETRAAGMTWNNLESQFKFQTYNASFPIAFDSSELNFYINFNLKAKVFASGNLALQNAGTFTDIPTAILQLNSTTQGFLPPRMTLSNRTGITSAATGLVVYQTDGTEGLYEKTSAGWRLINAAASGGGLTAANFVSDYDSVITGLRNSSNKVYTLTQNYQSGTTKVYVNGVRYSPGAGNDYTESAANQITFTNAPDSGDLILVDYIKS